LLADAGVPLNFQTPRVVGNDCRIIVPRRPLSPYRRFELLLLLFCFDRPLLMLLSCFPCPHRVDSTQSIFFLALVCVANIIIRTVDSHHEAAMGRPFKTTSVYLQCRSGVQLMLRPLGFLSESRNEKKIKK
jgi:hypothetical protein